MLTRDGCRGRQERFQGLLTRSGLTAAVITDPRDVYYLTGFLQSTVPAHPLLLWIDAENGDRSWLGASTFDGEALAGERLAYEPHLLFTMHSDLLRRLADVVERKLSASQMSTRLGWQAESLPHQIAVAIETAIHPTEWIAVDGLLAGLQKRKESDEIDAMRGAIRCSLVAYDAARATIAPGVTELAVLEAAHAAATLEAGQIVFHGGDYRSGQLGGFARNRAVQAGELYIIDAWSTFQGYWSDLCRTFPVGEPTSLQREVHEHIAEILRAAPSQLVPGRRGTEFWGWIDQRLREHPHLRAIELTHHAGHGVGLRGHEAPDLNRDREGILEPGDVVSVEPGAYSAALNAGVRLENTFRITETGAAELLSDYPLL
jgi:Xaa-Pro dipeptidase